MAGKLEFTQFDPLVAEKHSGLQGLKWEGNSIKRVENELNWIKSLTKSDITGIRIGYRNRISESAECVLTDPVGVVSKNSVGERKTELRSILCARVDARVVAYARVIDRTIPAKIVSTVRHANAPRYLHRKHNLGFRV